MTQRLAFELTRADPTDRFRIRLLDKAQVAQLARLEGVLDAHPVDAVVVSYDEGSGELVPVDGYDDSTPRGRITMRILSDVYCDALRRVESLAANARQTASDDMLVFQY